MATPPGQFLCWGCGEFGQHCHGNKGDVLGDEAAVDMFSGCHGDKNGRVKLFACGSSHTVVVTENNDILTWGNGSSGQLGSGEADIGWRPQKVALYAVQPENPVVAGVACGRRHTFVWLRNGHMFSFGNNFYAQLGYDFQLKNYKENQMKPRLLRTMTYRHVTQVACGEKHSAFLFRDGTVAAVGHNSNGQIGSGTREEAAVPKFLDDLPSVVYVACGANHSLAIDHVDNAGSVWQWGYGRACGSKKTDLLHPTRCSTLHNVTKVAGGQAHSLALTGGGGVYSWGTGTDGQLGHGEGVCHVSRPKRLLVPEIRGRAADIGAGENYSTVVNDEGELYVFGKTSHLLRREDRPRCRYYTPERVPLGGRTVQSVQCGAWHAAALTGKPDWVKESCSSDDEEYETNSVITEDGRSTVSNDRMLAPSNIVREKTTLTLAEFYAPTPDISSIAAGSLSPDVLDLSGRLDQGGSQSGSPSAGFSGTSHRPLDHPEEGVATQEVQGIVDVSRSCHAAQGSARDQLCPRVTECLKVGSPAPGRRSPHGVFVKVESLGSGSMNSKSEVQSRNKGDGKDSGDAAVNPESVYYLKDGLTFSVGNSKGDRSGHFCKPIGGVPSEKSVLPNKTLGIITIDSAKAHDHNLPISKHGLTKLSALRSPAATDRGLDKPRRAADLRSSSHSKTAMIAWRRSHKLRNGSSAVEIRGKHRQEQPLTRQHTDPLIYATRGTSTVDRALTVPHTVGVTPAGDLDLHHPAPRSVSIPGKRDPQQGKQISLRSERPRQGPTYSSATSWKHDAHRGHAKVGGIGQSTPATGEVQPTRGSKHGHGDGDVQTSSSRQNSLLVGDSPNRNDYANSQQQGTKKEIGSEKSMTSSLFPVSITSDTPRQA